MLFTEEGFEAMTADYYLNMQSQSECVVTVTDATGRYYKEFYLGGIVPMWNMEKGKIYVDSQEYRSYLSSLKDVEYTVNVSYKSTYFQYDYYDYESSKSQSFEKKFDKTYLTNQKPDFKGSGQGMYFDNVAFIDFDLWTQIAKEQMSLSYKQASLFFESDKAAEEAARELNENGYIAVPSDTKYEPSSGQAIVAVFECLTKAFVWFLMIVFLAFFINLCTSRSMSAFKGDMAIMRSMGIQVRVIRIAMYVRMFISLIPATIVMAVSAILIYTSPELNQHFTFLYAWQYALILVGMVLLTFAVTHKQVRKLFSESVKKSLKRGDTQ